MTDRHEDIAWAAEGCRLQWAALCVQFAAAGLTCLSEKPDSLGTAKRIWFRARDMVTEARAKQAAAAAQPCRVGAIPRSRISKDWQQSDSRRPENQVASWQISSVQINSVVGAHRPTLYNCNACLSAVDSSRTARPVRRTITVRIAQLLLALLPHVE